MVFPTSLAGLLIPPDMWVHYAGGLTDFLRRYDHRPRYCPDCTDDGEDPPTVVPCQACAWYSQGYQDAMSIPPALAFTRYDPDRAHIAPKAR